MKPFLIKKYNTLKNKTMNFTHCSLLTKSVKNKKTVAFIINTRNLHTVD